MFAQVIVDIASSAVDKVFDYDISNFPQAKKGMRVLVPFSGREIEGIIIGTSQSSNFDSSKIKSITKLLEDFPVVLEHQFSLMSFLRDKFHIGAADALRLFLPGAMRQGKVQDLCVSYSSLCESKIDEIYNLNSRAQKQILAAKFLESVQECERAKLTEKFGNSAVKALEQKGIIVSKKRVVLREPYKTLEVKNFGSFKLTQVQEKAAQTILSAPNKYLLFGVTGSGKTEVYLKCMEETIKQGKTGIMLVPEISLTPQTLAAFRARFGSEVAILHSGLSVGEKFDEWKRILLGKAKIVIGARSAIFAPLKNIGLIVIDEEHDSSYTSDSNPRYNTIEVAKFLSEITKSSLVLGSATPSLDSYYHAIKHEYNLIEMNERINKRELPPIKIVDMTHEFKQGNTGVFSSTLKTSLERTLADGNQAMLFINRRGYSSFLMCKECGYIAKCNDCDVSLVYHKHDNSLKCHYCGNRYKVLDVCPECKSHNLKLGSVGTEKVVEELKIMFPSAKILRMDNDTTRTKGAHQKLVESFKKGEADILVGTQMIVKGHDFPRVTLVGIVDADISLYQSSYMAAEKTFALITQVAGRAGRGNLPGEVVLQTNVPRHYIYRLAQSYDYTSFYKKEANLREVTNFPPFADIVRVLFTSTSEALAKSVTKEYYDKVKTLQQACPDDFVYFGVMKSPVGRIQGKFRFQVLMRLKKENASSIENKLFEFMNSVKKQNVQIFVEINPESLS